MSLSSEDLKTLQLVRYLQGFCRNHDFMDDTELEVLEGLLKSGLVRRIEDSSGPRYGLTKTGEKALGLRSK